MEMDYTYGVARIRALESSLFGNDTIQALLNLETYDQCMTFLRDKGWGDGHLDEILDDLVKDEKVVSILTIKDEFHNLKAAIKQVCTEDETENIFMAGCKIEPEFLKDVIRQGEYGKLPDNMAGVAKEATEILLKSGNGQLCDVLIDKATLEAIKKAGNESDNQLIRKYADSQVTIANIKIAVRCAATGKDSEFVKKCLVPCNGVSITDLIKAVDGGLEGVLEYLENSGFGDLAIALKKSKSVFECWCDNKIIEDIKSEKYNSFSVGPIVAYVIARENEIKTVKIIMSGKLNGFDNDFIKERVREMYA